MPATRYTHDCNATKIKNERKKVVAMLPCISHQVIVARLRHCTLNQWYCDAAPSQLQVGADWTSVQCHCINFFFMARRNRMSANHMGDPIGNRTIAVIASSFPA
jgi:hypothetical protein